MANSSSTFDKVVDDVSGIRSPWQHDEVLSPQARDRNNAHLRLGDVNDQRRIQSYVTTSLIETPTDTIVLFNASIKATLVIPFCKQHGRTLTECLAGARESFASCVGVTIVSCLPCLNSFPAWASERIVG